MTLYGTATPPAIDLVDHWSNSVDEISSTWKMGAEVRDKVDKNSLKFILKMNKINFRIARIH